MVTPNLTCNHELRGVLSRRLSGKRWGPDLPAIKGFVPIIVGVLILIGGPAWAVDVSTFSSAGCAFPDTNQSISYTATFGEDHDYDSSVSTMSFTLYVISGASVTVDNRTGLMWVTNQTQAGMSGTYTWANALTACEGLTYSGFTDWRLPNVRELVSIVDYGAAAAPRINTTAFPGTQQSSPYWTSTTYVPTTTNAVAVGFTAGDAGGSSTTKTSGYYALCVRGGP